MCVCVCVCVGGGGGGGGGGVLKECLQFELSVVEKFPHLLN